MTIEHSIRFYQQELSEEIIEQCRKKAIRGTTLQEAIDLDISYMELVRNKYMNEIIEAYRDTLRGEGE